MADTAAMLRNGNVSIAPAAVGFYLAARLCTTFLAFQSDPRTGAYVNFAIHLLLLAIMAFHSLGPARFTLREMLPARPFKLTLGFLMMGLCSLSWSSTASETVAFAYWCELASEVVMIVLAMRAEHPYSAALSIMRGYICGALLIAAVEWLSPTMYDLRPGDDDFFSPNAIGFCCALGVFLIQIAGRRTIAFRIAAIILIISLLRSLSKTTIIAFVLSQGALLLLDQSRSRRAKIMTVGVAMVVAASFWQLFESYYEVYTHLGNQSETLSGRIGIWAFVLTRALEQPWFGHGFHSFRNVIPPFGSFEAWHAHNELLQQFYAYGLLGVVLVGTLYASLFRQVRGSSSRETRARLTALLVFILIRGLADTENFDLSLPLWLISLISITLSGALPLALPSVGTVGSIGEMPEATAEGSA
ncbi:O-antigen ligase family protein [Occallatibacter savannae]|uniref:O-antigen ligase family protein n=1 Tax=Occallatibacter savannae TaxID=1002691 RepID=UPI000D68FA36|nr:O-antigen ligase family protein [Occallatibacter savannae]